MTHGHPAAGKVLAGHLRAYSSSWKPFARFVQQHRLTPDQVEKFIGPDANRFVQGVAYAPGVATVRDEYLDACRSRDHATQTVVEGSFDNIDSARNLLGDIAPSWKGDAGCVVELLKDLTDKG